MAKKRIKRRASGYTIGPAPIRRRKMNGVKTTRRRSRRMNSAIGTEAKDVVGMAVGALLGGFAIGAAERLTSNYYVRAGGVGLVGLLVAQKMPALRSIGKGMAVAGVVGIGQKVMANSGIMPGTINGKRKLTADELRKLTASMKMREALPVLNGDIATLNAAQDAVVIY